MSQQPNPYSPGYSFTGFSVNNPDAQQPGQYLDQEFFAIQSSINSTINRLNEIQRDDGELKLTDQQTAELAANSEGVLAASAEAAVLAAAGGSHTHSISQIVGLQSSIDSKASNASLTSGLSGKAPLYHNHSILEVNNLQAALDSKAPLAHSHSMDDVLGLDTQLYGRIIGQVILPYGAGTYNVPTEAKSIYVEVQAGGGGGAGCAATTTNAVVSSGGGGGGYSSLYISGPAVSYSYTVGEAGSGGLAGNNSGSAGGNSSFGANLITCNGGGGGTGYVGQFAGGFYYALGVSGGAAGGGDVNVKGGNSPLVGLSAYGLSVSMGGHSRMGNPGMTSFNSNSQPGNGYGSGGSGVCSWTGQPARAGGAGGPGVIRIWLFG